MKFWVLLLALCLSCDAKPAAPKARCKQSALRPDFDNAPLTEVVKAVGAAACVTMNVSEALRDERLTLFSTTELAPSDLLAGFAAALSGSQLILTKDGGEYLISRAKE